MCIVVKEEPRSSSVNLIVAMDVAMSSELLAALFCWPFGVAHWPLANALLIVLGIELQ